jgi:cytoskeleton protein RodZ
MRKVLLMSDGLSPVRDDDSDAVNLTPSLTAGRMLRNAREAVGLHVGALAVSMKIPVKKLEALEADRFDLLPDAVFVRALASSVCRTLKIDATPVLEKLPRNHVPELGPGIRSVNEPFYAYGKSGGLSFLGLFAKPSALWVLVLLIGSIAVFFLPELQKINLHGGQNAALEGVNPQLSPASTAIAPQDVASMPEPNLVAEERGSAAQTFPPELPQPVAANSAVVQPVVRTAAFAGVGGATQQADMVSGKDGANDPGADLLTLKARAPTWVKVVDAKGTVQLMKILVLGESANVGGVAPLSVVIGAADSLDVKVRGLVFDLQSVAKDNVARFEVK